MSTSSLPEPDLDFYRTWALPVFRSVSRYHRYDIRGAEHVPEAGPAILILTHAMLTYDALLLQAGMFERTGRLACGLGDRFWFDTLRVGSVMVKCGHYNTSPETARELVESGHLVGLMPGGMWEALRPSTERYQLRWEGRTGFARLALATGAPIILAACPAADLALTLYANPITDSLYRTWKIPLPLMRGVGPTWIPRPVQLTHHLHPPITPPRCRGKVPEEEEVLAFRDQVKAAMSSHIEACRRDEGL